MICFSTSGRQVGFRQVNHLQIHLLRQRLSQLIVRDQPHFFGDLPELFTRLLLLFFQQHFELIVVDKTHVDENLPNTTNCHVWSSATR